MKDKIFILYSLYKTRFKEETNITICSLISIKLHLRVIDVYVIINTNGASASNFVFKNIDPKRKSYKRAWFLYKKEKVNGR